MIPLNDLTPFKKRRKMVKSKEVDRKQTPVFTGVLKYFPDAIKCISKVSLQGNLQHHPDKPLHWDKSKSADDLDALARHLIDAGTIDDDGIRHSAKVAWRALANLQRELEQDVTDQQWYIDQYNRKRKPENHHGKN